MATHAADPREQNPDSDTATLERKRPHDVISYHNASNLGSAHSTPRKRARKAGKLGHQDVRDFVPVGASFSTSVVPIDEIRESGDDGSQEELDLNTETLSDNEPFEVSESNSTEAQQKALVEGRRLFISDLPVDITEEQLRQFFKGYSVENIWLPDRNGDNSQLDTTAHKDDVTMDRESSDTNPTEGSTVSTKNGCRLWVGNLSYAATVEDLREFFREFSIEKVTIPANPRTCRPVGYAFVTVSSSDEADHAISQLSGNEILERKVSIQRARAEETEAPDPGNTTAKEKASATRNKHAEGYHDKEGELEEIKMLHEVSEAIPSPDVQAALPVSWNAVNTTKIRTTLGGRVDKVNVLIDEPTATNAGETELEGRSSQDVATSVALERVKALRFRLSSMNPHDGPVSAYISTKQELHNAEVDYNYCLYFPSDEVFQFPPLSTAHKSTTKKNDSGEYRLRLRSVVEQCMKQGTLRDLKDGKIRVSNAELFDQVSPAQMEQVDGQEVLQVLTATDPKQVQVLETQETYQKQQGYLISLRNVKPGTPSYETMKKRVHETEIHLNYCKYFPATEDYLPLALAKQGLNEIKSSKVDSIKASERRAAQILKLVEQCTQDGILHDLKDGRLAAWLKDVPPPNQSFFASALQAKQPQGIISPKSKPPHGGRLKDASKRDAAATSADMEPIPKDEGLPNDRQDNSESDNGVILNLDLGNQDMPSMSEDENVRPPTKSESMDEEELLDADEKDVAQEQTATKPADDDINASDSGTASNSDTESSDSSMGSEGQSEDGDAMMQYSNSEQITADVGGQIIEPFAVTPSHTASVLADLSPCDLNAQLRYFHTTKAREQVDRKTPVRCLVCAKEGHMAVSCESLTCSTCGAFNRHTTQACPDGLKCGKCREQGHDESQCPYKLRKMPSHEIVCDLCQRNGHIENDCELIWRTSGRPWESDLADANVRLSCYECGHSGHLGNDCPSRKPKKSIGTSTWNGNMGPVSIMSTREIKIKGKATRQDPINLDDSDDERAKFYRPKITLPEPVRRGQIRIVTGRHESPVYESSRNDKPTYADHQYGSFTPINDGYRNDAVRKPYQKYRDQGRGNWRAVDGPDYATGHDDIRYNNHRSNERRSRSPPYRDHEGYAGDISWPPPRPAPRAEHQDRRPRADANVYRPMPSAAQNAWARRRL